MAGYIGSNISVASPGAEKKFTYIATAGQTLFSQCSYSVGYLHVFHNGVRLVEVTDYTATTGNSFTLTVAANVGDEIVAISYGTFNVADAYTKSESDDRYLSALGDITINGQMEQDNLPLYGVRAFVNFAGSTGTIRHSRNVSSITRVGTGEYRINFITPMPDVDYIVQGTISHHAGVTWNAYIVSEHQNSFTTNCYIYTRSGANGDLYDPLYVHVAIFW